MARKLIRAVLTTALVQQILAAVQGITAALPFLEAVSPWERRTLPKTGRKRLGFVEKAAEVVRQNPGLCPDDFNAKGFVMSAELFAALLPIFTALEKLFESISDTTLEVGADSYTQALDVYEFVKRMTKKMPGLDSAKKDLARLMKESRTPDPDHKKGLKKSSNVNKKNDAKGTEPQNGGTEPQKGTESPKA